MTAGARSPTAAAAAPSRSGTTLEVGTDPRGRLSFDKRLLRTTAGPVTLIMDNPSPVSHNLALVGPGVHLQGPTVATYGVSTIRATLRRGRYTFYCSLHRRAGMWGVLEIR